jgi:hypothetical protein
VSDDNELITTEQSTVIAVAPKSADALAVRIAKEVEGAMLVAKRFPRDEFACIERIKKSFQRQRLAEQAEYEFPRGGTKVVGPSAHCLRAVKSAWGNIQSGWVEIERKLGQSTVIAYAMDLETNARAELTFQVKHLRDTKHGPKLLTDERDIYEHVANMAARRERKCLQDIIPADVIDEAIDQAHRTLKGATKEPIEDRVRIMVSVFAAQGVTIEMIERRLGHKLAAISENKLAELRRVYASIKDGVGKVEDFFDSSEPEKKEDQAEPGQSKAERTAGKMKKQKEQQSASDADRSAKIRENVKRALDSAFAVSVTELEKTLADIQDKDNPVVSDDDRNWALEYVAEIKKGFKS